MGYAASTPSHPTAPIPEVGWPSTKSNPQTIRAIGQHPNIIVIARADAKGAPSAGGINKVPTQESPAGCFAVFFYPHPAVRPSEVLRSSYQFEC